MMKCRNNFQCISVITLFLFMAFAAIAGSLQRDFRGAWIATVYQDGYLKRSTARNKAYLCQQLDILHAAGINVVFFQVRAQADAFYSSELEPWSRYLTNNGAAPSPFWDPLQFMVEECHARGMELHAWVNPYRVTTSAKQTVPRGHLYHKEPKRFFRYDGKIYFDPGLPENRAFIVKVVDDIVSRYDIDGIHCDDYFYPYPTKGKPIVDDATYARYGKGMTRDMWRRRNVDLLIEALHKAIVERKPWVRFGVSPFGIWRNKKNDSRGSETSGLQNYDDLYADVLLWEEKGWIDYLLPQIYWNIGNKLASYPVLVDWWNDNAGKKRHLYVGQDIDRTMKAAIPQGSKEKSQLRRKFELARKAINVRGNCWWPGYSLTANVGGVADSLRILYHNAPALVPAYPWKGNDVPEAVDGIEVKNRIITWKSIAKQNKLSDVTHYAVYRYDDLEEIETKSHGSLVAVVVKPQFAADVAGIYTITALNRINNESSQSNPVIVQ